MCWSLSGCFASSPTTIALMRSLTLSEDTSSPLPVLMLEVKKNFSSKMPCGVCTYLLAVARLTVDSCMPMSSATSFSTSGCRWAMPLIEEVALELDDARW